MKQNFLTAFYFFIYKNVLRFWETEYSQTQGLMLHSISQLCFPWVSIEVTLKPHFTTAYEELNILKETEQ